MTHNTLLPKPEMRGFGTITYRCAGCGEHIAEDPWFSDGRWIAREPIELNANVKTYHREHLPNGR